MPRRRSRCDGDPSSAHCTGCAAGQRLPPAFGRNRRGPAGREGEGRSVESPSHSAAQRLHFAMTEGGDWRPSGPERPGGPVELHGPRAKSGRQVGVRLSRGVCPPALP
jgi:hypothetical protein